jgi:hypothetical protein
MTREEWDTLQNSLKKEYKYIPTGNPGEVKKIEVAEDDKNPKQKGKVIDIADNRKLDAITGLALNDKNRLSSKGVSIDDIKNIIEEAKKNNIDPYTALAISFQETGIGTRGNKTANGMATYHLNPDVYGTNATNDPKLGIKAIADQLKYGEGLQKRKIIPEGEDYKLQSFGGYGTIKKGHQDLEGSTSIYGIQIPDEGLDQKKNPMYGKRALDIRENILKKNPDIVNLIEGSNKN